MSFIAGIVSISGGRLPEARRAIAQSALDLTSTSPTVYSTAEALVAQVDLGAHFASGFCEHAEGVGVLAGHPLLPEGLAGAAPAANRGCEVLCNASAQSRLALASASNGNWAGAFYHRRNRELTLLGDRLASRPLYWWTDGEEAVFSSTLRFLELLPFVTSGIELQGLLERASLGFSLSDRTPYHGVRRLLAGEAVVLRGRRVDRTRFWRWSNAPERADLDLLAHETLHSFRAAVERRRAGRTTAITTLSGGLDSRAVNVLLHEAGVRIRSFNYSNERSLDAEFGRKFAEAIGATHFQGRLTMPALDLMATDTRGARECIGDKAQCGPIWLGTGGGTCAGGVFMTTSIVRAMRNGDPLRAARHYLADEAAMLSPIDLRHEARHWTADALESAIFTELQQYPTELDPARKFFLFIIENHDRRNLDEAFEGILTHRQEVWTPYLDGTFLDHSLSVPVDAAFGHAFYDRWFQLLPSVARSVPWQTYPGHLPCPLSIPEGLNYQWSSARRARPPFRQRLSAWPDHLFGPGVAASVFRRTTLIARGCLHLMGVRDESSFLQVYATIDRYWRRAQHPTLPWRTVKDSTSQRHDSP